MAKLAINGGQPYRTAPFPTWPIPSRRGEELLLKAYRERLWSYYGAGESMEVEFARQFAALHTARYGYCVSNGTDSLKVALRAVGVMPGDEVIVPGLTWLATGTAPLRVGAVTVYADIDPGTYCIDPADIRRKITPRTKAIIPVHLYSGVADMDAIMEIAREHNLAVIEDCAHAHGEMWKDRGVGSIGDFGSFSFQQSKVLTGGEGGMLITNDHALLRRAFSLLNCGRPFEGEAPAELSSSHHDEEALAGDESLVGDNYRIGGFAAAVLLANLPELLPQIEHKRVNLEHLDKSIAGIKHCKPMVRDPRVTRRAGYEWTFRYDGPVPGVTVRRALEAEGLPMSDPYTPVYRSRIWQPTAREFPQLKGVDYTKVDCPVTERASTHESMNLLHHNLLGTKQDMDDILGAVEKVMTNLDELA